MIKFHEVSLVSAKLSNTLFFVMFSRFSIVCIELRLSHLELLIYRIFET